jgi:hypothetical protein
MTIPDDTLMMIVQNATEDDERRVRFLKRTHADAVQTAVDGYSRYKCRCTDCDPTNRRPVTL